MSPVLSVPTVRVPAPSLPALQRQCLFRSSERVESHEMVAREFSDHDLTWHGGAVDTVFYKTAIHRLKVFQLQYGAEVEIKPRPFDDFILVHLTLAGLADIDCDAVRTCLRPGQAAVLSPRSDLHMRWQQGSQQFIVKVPRALLAPAGDVAADLRLENPLRVLDPAESAQWQWLVQGLLQAGALPGGGPAHDAWVDHVENNIGLFLASRQGLVPAVPTVSRRAGARDDERRLVALDTYIRSHLGAPVGVADLARAAGVGVRTLTELCNQHHGQSPMALLRDARLDAVRSRLLADRHVSVTEAALECGFGHLGRFAGYYLARFGEQPSQTARFR